MDTRTVTAASSRRDALATPQEQFVLVIDRTRPLDAGARHGLANIECVTIGRGRLRCADRVVADRRGTLRLALPDDRVSSLHARLDRHADGWRLTDCDSTNGTRVNGRLVTKAGPTSIGDGDIVEVGHTFFRYRASVETPVGAPGDFDASNVVGLARQLATLHPRIARDADILGRLATTDVALLLLGETGTGKEVLARAVHAESGRNGAFVAVNCGALPANLVESLLFGHVRGAFSGALRDETGLVRAAEGGTLFLDEIGDLALDAQVALLRVIQEREVLPVGATRSVPIDLRLVAATHRPLEKLTESGAFRDDLLARLTGYVYAVPPLRDRMDDLGLLVAAILKNVAGERARSISLSADAIYSLLEHGWPHNVRELEQRLKTAVALAVDGRIERARLWNSRGDGAPARGGSSRGPRSPEDDALAAELAQHLTTYRGNVTRVGDAMGKSRTQVQRWLRRLGIDAERFRR
jgi:transcriptional regulator with AAA-type ATPase domain